MLFRGVDIVDWHRGDMSSRRLLVLLKGLSQKGEYWTARRDGDWSDDEYRQAAVVNELRLLRVDQAAINGQKMDAELMESPAQQAASEEVRMEHNAQRAGILAQLHGQSLGKRPDDHGS